MTIFNRRILIFPKIVCWIIFVIHFSFLIGFHGVINIDKSEYGLILDIVLLIILQSIALFITLSQIHNSYVFFKYAFFFSILNVLAFLLSVLNYSFCYQNNNSIFESNNEFIKNNTKLLYIFFFSIKLIEICPLFILIFLCKKFKKDPGNIEKALNNINNIDNNENNSERNEYE